MIKAMQCVQICFHFISFDFVFFCHFIRIIYLLLELSHWTITMSTIPLKLRIKWINKLCILICIYCFFYANVDHIYIMFVVVVVVEIWDGWFDVCHFHLTAHMACGMQIQPNSLLIQQQNSNISIHSYIIYLDTVLEKVWGFVWV